MNANRSRLRLSGTNLKRVADHNQRITLHAIRVHGPLTRMDLARITGLTPPAIANITRRLLADGLIEEAGRRRGGRGSPPANLIINQEACYSIGLNVDRDHISVVLVNFVGETIASSSFDAAELPAATSTIQNSPPGEGRGRLSRHPVVVELRGLEPLTSTLPVLRSPS